MSKHSDALMNAVAGMMKENMVPMADFRAVVAVAKHLECVEKQLRIARKYINGTAQELGARHTRFGMVSEPTGDAQVALRVLAKMKAVK